MTGPQQEVQTITNIYVGTEPDWSTVVLMMLLCSLGYCALLLATIVIVQKHKFTKTIAEKHAIMLNILKYTLGQEIPKNNH